MEKTSNKDIHVKVIAEVGSVHDGSLGNAVKLIDLSAGSGADIVKFQTHIAEAETLKDAPMPPYFKGEPRYEYFKRTAFTEEEWAALKSHSDEIGIGFLSSPFSVEAVELLERIGVTRFKVPSGEVTNLPLLRAIAATKKEIFLSSGMSSWGELDAAVNTIIRENDKLTILQCTSEYPCNYENVGINVMLEMKERYGYPVGISDHTLTNYASFAAVVLGASVVEKHLTFSRMMYGSDARHSLEPAEFKDLVTGIRAIEEMMNSHVDKDDISRYSEMKATFEKSVVSVLDIDTGTVITEEMLGFKKPGTGIPARKIGEVIGKRAVKKILKDNLINEDDYE